MADHWVDALRVISLVGLGYGAWQGWRNRPPSLFHDGRKYYRLKDGRFCNRWGRIVTDPGRLAALTTRFESDGARASS